MTPIFIKIDKKGDYYMDSFEISRFLTGMTFAVHIIFSTIGVCIHLMFSIAEFICIRKNDANYIALAKRWS